MEESKPTYAVTHQCGPTAAGPALLFQLGRPAEESEGERPAAVRPVVVSADDRPIATGPQRRSVVRGKARPEPDRELAHRRANGVDADHAARQFSARRGGAA